MGQKRIKYEKMGQNWDKSRSEKVQMLDVWTPQIKMDVGLLDPE